MRSVAQHADRPPAKSSLPSTWRMLFLICSALVLCAVRLHTQCPDNGQTKVFNSKQGTGYYFYKFLGDSSFRYFLNGKTFSYNEKDDPGRAFAFIDDMAYELIIEDRADFSKYIKGSKPQDILLAQARYEQDHLPMRMMAATTVHFISGKSRTLRERKPRHNIWFRR